MFLLFSESLELLSTLSVFVRTIIISVLGETMDLSGRLKAIADAVPRSVTAADIGTDHGYIPLYLIEKGIIERAIAADVSPGSLRKAEQLIRDRHMHSCMETRLGSGLAVLTPGEADTIIIAGMGGMLISDILEHGIDVARSASVLILQPMQAQDAVRRWLISSGFLIIDEYLVKEGRRYYEIITACPGHGRSGQIGFEEGRADEGRTDEGRTDEDRTDEGRAEEGGSEEDSYPGDDIYYEIGWKLIEKGDPLLREYILHKIGIMRQIADGLGDDSDISEPAAARKAELEARIARYEEVLRWDIR